MKSIDNIGLNESKRSKTNSKFNKLVPQLIEQSNKLTKELKYRIKLNTFFSEFENKASNQFKFFIKESGTRYRGSKSGSDLDSLIASSRKKCLKEANKVINDNFYSNNDILIEKEKMKIKTTNKIYKNFTETLSQLKGLAKSNTNSLSNSRNLNINLSSPKSIKRKKKLLKNKKKLSLMSMEKLTKGKNDIHLFLNKETLLFHKTMDNYKNKLNSLNSLNDENQKYSYAHKNMFLGLPNLNLLTYKKYVPPPIDPDEEEKLRRVNFKKLLPYSRLGKNLGYSQKNYRGKNKNNAFITQPEYAFYTNYGDYMKNIKNTNEIVFNTANKEFNMESRFNRKRKIIENILGENNIPQLDSYEVLIKDIFNKRREKNLKTNKNNMFDIKREEEAFNDKENNKLLKGFNFLNDIEKKFNSYYTQDAFNKQ